MLNIPSPILILGDECVSKNIIVSVKKKYKNANWEVLDATEQDADDMRMTAGFNCFGGEDKIVLIQNIPNKKAVREFLLDLVESSSDSVKFILFDSNNHIKIDPKTGEYGKTWSDFVKRITDMSGSKVIDNGGDFTEKENINCVKYVQDLFKKKSVVIDDRATMKFIEIVGKNKGMIFSEVSKMSVNCPSIITEDFIVENAFPSCDEGVLYKFGNAIDSANYSHSIFVLETFLNNGLNEYLIADILLRKARWQMVVAHLWYSGVQWGNISDKIMVMGKFPSFIWHNENMSDYQKKNETVSFGNSDVRIQYMTEQLGIPEDYFEKEKISSSKKNPEETEAKPVKSERGEIIPQRFMAQQIVDFVRMKIVEPNRHNFSSEELKEKVFDRALNYYLECSELYKGVRYSKDDVKQNIYEMIKILTDCSLLIEQ